MDSVYRPKHKVNKPKTKNIQYRLLPTEKNNAVVKAYKNVKTYSNTAATRKYLAFIFYASVGLKKLVDS